MTDPIVTSEMLTEGRRAAAFASGNAKLFSDDWWMAVYRAMRRAEPQHKFESYPGLASLDALWCKACGRPNKGLGMSEYTPCPGILTNPKEKS